jgi:hypothetical protein
MCANGWGEVLPAPRAYVRPATEQIGGKLHEAEAEATGQASNDDVIRAVDEEQVTLFRCQASGPRTFDVRQRPLSDSMMAESAMYREHFEHFTCIRRRPLDGEDTITWQWVRTPGRWARLSRTLSPCGRLPGGDSPGRG